MKDKNIKIAGSLEEGEVYTSAFFYAVYLSFAACLIAVCALVIVACIENNSVFLYSAIFIAVLAVLIGYFVFTDAAKRVRCHRCLKDGVIVTARGEKIMATPPSYVKDKNKYIKICLEFEYKGKQRRILSGKDGYTGRGSLEKAGFAAINREYVNCEKQVVYSPSLNKIVFLADSGADKHKNTKKV